MENKVSLKKKKQNQTVKCDYLHLEGFQRAEGPLNFYFPHVFIIAVIYNGHMNMLLL